MADTKIKTKNPGILEVPEDKKFWQLPLSHYEKLVDKKGYAKIIRALTNLEVWNKNDDPKISKKASDIADKLKKKYKKEARLVETDKITYDLLDEITNKINEDFYKKSYKQRKSVGEWDIDINFAYNNNSSVQAENMDSLVEWKQKDSGIIYTDYTGKKLFFNDLNDLLYIIEDFPIDEFRESINQVLKDVEKYYPIYNNKYKRKIEQKYKKEALEKSDIEKYIDKDVFEISDLSPVEFKIEDTIINGYNISDLYIFTIEDYHKMCDMTADIIASKLGDTFGKLFDRKTAAELMKDDPISFEAGLTLIEHLDEDEDFLYKFNEIEDSFIVDDEEYLILKED